MIREKRAPAMAVAAFAEESRDTGENISLKFEEMQEALNAEWKAARQPITLAELLEKYLGSYGSNIPFMNWYRLNALLSTRMIMFRTQDWLHSDM